MIHAEVTNGYLRLLDDLSAAPEQMVKEIEAEGRNYAAPLWKRGLAERAETLGQRRTLVDGADVETDAAAIRFLAAQSRSPLSGGLIPSQEWAGYEFGATPKTLYISWRGRRRFQRINVQFAPRRSKGKVVWPLARVLGPRWVGRWVVAAVRGIGQGNPDIETTRS